MSNPLTAERRQRPLVSVERTRRDARRALPRPVFDIVDGGSDDEITLRRNRRGFEELALRQRVGIDRGRPDLSSTLHDTPLTAPIVFAPCGLAGLVHPSGELAVARAARRNGTLAMFSTFSTYSLVDIARASGGPKWFQLYFLGGRTGADALVDRAAAAGYEGLVLTLDTPVAGHHDRDHVNGVSLPFRLSGRAVARLAPAVLRHPGWLLRFARAGFPLELGNAQLLNGNDVRPSASEMFSAPPTWDDVARLRERWTGTLAVKGILDPDDARRAVRLGADVIVVSNHGGRQLDSVVATIDVLPRIADAVGDEVDIVLDGGVRRGTDIVKALALGAKAVAVGRPYLYGLGVAGESGVDAVWSLLADELERALRLMGCGSVRELSSAWIDRVSVDLDDEEPEAVT